MVSHKIFIFGLDFAGKTTLTTYIKDEKVIQDSTPTLTFSIDSLIINDMEFIMWDAPGQVNYRKKWARGILDAKILMFVIDTSDESRFAEAKKEFDIVLNDLDTRNIPLIVCFHKMDLEGASENYIKAREELKLGLINDRAVKMYKTSVNTGEGVQDLKDGLVELIEKERWG